MSKKRGGDDVLHRLRFRVEWSRQRSMWEGTIEQWHEAKSAHHDPSGALSEIVELARAAIADNIAPSAVLTHRSREVWHLAHRYGFDDIAVSGLTADREDDLASRLDLTIEPYRSPADPAMLELQIELARLLGFQVRLHRPQVGRPTVSLNTFVNNAMHE